MRRGIGIVIVAIGVFSAPATASAALTFSNVPSATEVRSGDAVTFTMTVGNTGPDAEQVDVGSIYLRMGGEKSVNNPAESVSSPNGSCTIDPVSGGYHGTSCQLNVPAGGTAQITEIVRVNESMDNFAGVLDSRGAIVGPADRTRVQAIYPPRFLVDSNKIKVKGLPDGCVDRDFTVTVTAKGAKKVTAGLAGPYDEWHGRLFGSGFSNKIGAASGKKLKVEVPLERERAGFYDLKLASKYENGPKQKTEINIQRCGIPDG